MDWIDFVFFFNFHHHDGFKASDLTDRERHGPSDHGIGGPGVGEMGQMRLRHTGETR